MEFDIYFRALKMEDAVFINNLRKDQEIEEKLASKSKYVPLERDQKWVEDLLLHDDPSKMYGAIAKKGSEDIIGYISVSNIDYRNGTCLASGIKISSSEPNRLYGLQAILLGAKLVFEELRMARMQTEVLEIHHGSLHLMERVGFKREGLMRNFVYKNGAHQNCWLLSMTKEDYVEIKERYKL